MREIFKRLLRNRFLFLTYFYEHDSLSVKEHEKFSKEAKDTYITYEDLDDILRELEYSLTLRLNHEVVIQLKWMDERHKGEEFIDGVVERIKRKQI